MPEQQNIKQTSSMHNFDEYIRQVEPDKKEKGLIWKTAIGLQQVDGLKPSEYLIQTAIQNIEGDITFEEVKNLIDNYYKAQVVRQDSGEDDRTEEADKVSARIAEILSEKTFSFSPIEYLNIHRRLFVGIYKFAGKIRDYNITKAEWALDGDTVLYAGADNLRATLEYDFEQEKKFDFKGLNPQQVIEHIAHFISFLWQIHIFGEGNTRTTAVFLIKYLRKLGFKNINNDLFAQHSWYFRNALVRANYADVSRNIAKTEIYLNRFFANLVFGENNMLKNRELHIDFMANVGVSDTVKQKNDTVKAEDDTVNDTVFNLIKENPNITAEEIRIKLNIGIATVKRKIKMLKEKGIITRLGSDKTGSWKIN
jgi:fido (protein-threonine AMPylation protein)